MISSIFGAKDIAFEKENRWNKMRPPRGARVGSTEILTVVYRNLIPCRFHNRNIDLSSS